MTQEPITPISVRPATAFTPRGLHGTVVEQLGAQIVSGGIKPDDLLQPEQIGAAYEVSRTVVREALRVLEDKGLITARPNVGTRIRPVEQWNLLDADVIRWRKAARREEPVDHDVAFFCAHLRALHTVLAGNLLYDLMMESLTGVPRSAYAVVEETGEATGAQPVVERVPSMAGPDAQGAFVATALGEADHGAAVERLAEAAA